jgi:hypothetical protein
VDYVAYLNHEAVPETLGEIENWFAEVSLFKRNPHTIPQAFLPYGELNTSLPQISFWTSRGQGSGSHDEPKLFFHAYSNGKSAARVVPGLRPRGVHRWGSQNAKCQYYDTQHAVILHFCNCGLASFLAKHQALLSCTSSYVADGLYRNILSLLRSGRGDLETEAARLYHQNVCLAQSEQPACMQACVRVDLAGWLGSND